MTDLIKEPKEIGVRELARRAGISPTTASKIKRGDTHDMNITTLRKVLPYLTKCPCCGAKHGKGE